MHEHRDSSSREAHRGLGDVFDRRQDRLRAADGLHAKLCRMADMLGDSERCEKHEESTARQRAQGPFRQTFRMMSPSAANLEAAQKDARHDAAVPEKVRD